MIWLESDGADSMSTLREEPLAAGFVELPRSVIINTLKSVSKGLKKCASSDVRRNRFRLFLPEPPDPFTADGHPARGSSGVASPSALPPSSPQSKAARREEAKAALTVLAGLAEHDSCVPLMMESGDLGCLFQVSFEPRLFCQELVSKVEGGMLAGRKDVRPPSASLG